jgi:hypothetical protein
MKELVIFKPPKTLHIHLGSVLSPNIANELFEKWAGFIDPKEKIKVLVDVNDLREIPPESREIIRKRATDFHISLFAIFGASVKIRIMSGLIIKMMRNVEKSKFFETKEEAIAWLNNK